MKSIKSLVVTCVALAVGFASGAYLSRPPKVKASTTIFHIQKVVGSGTLGNSPMVLYDDYVGFSCTAQDCYILTR